MNELAVRVQNISKTYTIREKRSNTLKGFMYNLLKPKGDLRKIEALKDITFSVNRGEALGIIGRNGSGKTTLMHIILGAIRHNKGGSVYTNGEIIKLSLGLGFNMNMSARDNIYMNGSLLGLPIKSIKNNFEEIIDFSGLRDFVETPVKYYSKGMKRRLAFSVAVKANADIFLLDEFFGGVGDEEFKKKSNDLFIQKMKEGKTLIMVSHGRHILKKFCSRVIWIDNGSIKMEGNTSEVLKAYHNVSQKNTNIIKPNTSI